MPALLGPSLCLGCLNPSCLSIGGFLGLCPSICCLKRDPSSSVSDIAEKIYPNQDWSQRGLFAFVCAVYA